MSWTPAARTATAVVRLGQQQEQQLSPKHRQRQQQPQQRQILQQQQLVQPRQLTTQPHQQLRTQRSQLDSLSPASVHIHELAGRRCHNANSRNAKNGSGGEAVSGEHAPPTRKSCNSCNSVSGEGAGKRGTQPGSAIVASQMFKTKLCIDHQTRGCTRGDTCPYAHSVEEMRNLPDLRKTKMCSLVLAGKGCKNRACKFAHSEEELRYTCTFSEFKTRICRFAQERGGRGCLYGVRCPYAHSPSELRRVDSSTVLSADNDHAKEKKNGVDDDGSDGVLGGQRRPRNNPNLSDLHDIKGKHGLWRQQQEHSTTQQQPQQQKENDAQQQEKEQLKQEPHLQMWQKSRQQKHSQQASGEQKLCQRQQQDCHQQKKQPQMQSRLYYRQQLLKNIEPIAAWPSRNSGDQPQQQDEAETKETCAGEALDEAPLSGAPSSRRSGTTSGASPFSQQKDPSSSVDRSETRKKAGGFALAKLPRSLNKGTRAASTMADNSEAGLKSISEGRPRGKIILNSAEHTRQEHDVHQWEHTQIKATEPDILEYHEAGSQTQSSASLQHVPQHCWEREVAGHQVGTYVSPELVECQRTFLSVGKTPQRYLSTASSPGTSLPSRIVTSLAAVGEERSTAENTYDVGGAYGDTRSDEINDSHRECLRIFSTTSGTNPPGIGTDTPTSERDQSWPQQSISSTRYNCAAAVLPPPGFEHVRAKPLSDFAYAGTAPWMHTSANTETSNREQYLLFHLHKQLLLHCQRQSDAHLLPSANIMSHPPSTSNASTAVKMSSAVPYLGGARKQHVGERVFDSTSQFQSLKKS